MKKHLRKIACLLLIVTISLSGAAAYSSDKINTKFEYLLWQIEMYSLYTQNTEMPRSEVDYWNAYLEKHPDELETVVNKYLAKLDTHSKYLTLKEYDQGFSQLVGYVGIGVQVQQTPEGTIVSNVNRSGPAHEAGMRAGDQIARIDGKDAATMTNTDIAELLRGTPGTSVVISVLRDGKMMTFNLVRRQIQQEYVAAQTVAEGVEYIRVDAMGSEDDLVAFKEIWNGLDEKNTKAVILDLRSNGGGLVDVAWGMADTILENKGTYMGSIQWRQDMGGLEKHYATGGGLPLNKISVLVDQNTASAAELLTGILKEAGGANVIGQKTYGKGQGQYHLSMPDGKSRLVITTLEMNLPKSPCWEGVGIEPTIQVLDSTNVNDYIAGLPALNTAQKLAYGAKSEQVRALYGRLFLLGYAGGASDVFDTEMLSALRRFQKDHNLTQRMVADTETLTAVNKEVQKLSISNQFLDNVFYKALDLSKQAAALPSRYQAKTDGSWRAA